LSQNLLLQGGDTIFVPRAETVFVTGQVRAAGEFPFRKGMTVRQALALAGGLTDRGSSRRIEIVRKIDGRERTVDASLPDLLQPGDTLIVKERFF
jgi:polysaccharide export outer membrane protein